MRRLCFAPLLLLALAAGSATASPPLARVPCDEVILDTTFPYVTGDYRLVLGTVSVPGFILRDVYPSSTTPWRTWRKAGLVVGNGAAVDVSVPPAWRTRLANRTGKRTATVWFGIGETCPASRR